MNCEHKHIRKRQSTFVLVFLLLIAFVLPLGAQTILTGNSENEYSKVTYLHVVSSSDVDSVDVEAPGLFAADDIVMLYNPKGWVFDPLNEGFPDDFDSHVGQYAIMIVDKIEGNTVIFNAATKFYNPYLNDLSSQRDHFASQLIKVPRYDNARVTGTLTAPAWDSVSGTGGVLALYVQHELDLDGVIDMTGKGFKGGDPGGDVYGGLCIDSVALSQRFYPESAADSSGRKGESMLCTDYPPLRGYSKTLTGGGGGNGKYSGGGGGGNFSGGGIGGGSIFDCAFYKEYRAEGGNGLAGTYYTNSNAFGRVNRIYFGGGGGCGTQDSLAGYDATAGGNGGGIIVIIADTINANSGYAIYADGESVTDVATGPGGGGGGGGVIVLETNGTKGELELYARGGKGGDTKPETASEFTGPGGGGGGGVTWVSNSSDIISNIAEAVQGDYMGSVVPAADDLASGGAAPQAIDNLIAPLKGFLFNTISEDLTVCSDVIPAKIDGSLPKGGDGPGTYTYRWVQSTDMLTWTDASEVNTNEDYVFTVPLATTTHFSRVVQSGVMIDSLNLIVTYTVVPAITNNLISANDTICKGLAPHALNSSGVPGGATVGVDGVYIWQRRGINEAVWTDVDNSDNVHSYSPPTLDTSTYYRREVLSSVCQSYSNTLEMKVLEPLGNLDITSIDTVCNGQVPGTLDGGSPINGDQNKIWYKWEVSDTEFSAYTTVGDTEDYTEGSSLLSDKYYRRTVYSGRDSTCVSTPVVFKIEVLDKISGNDLVSAEDTICRGAVDPITTAIAVSGGDGIYSYTWEVNPDGGGWTSLAGSNIDLAYDEEFTGVSTEVRRVVVSGKVGFSAGDVGVCTDIAVLTDPVITIPVITDNTIVTADTAACEGVDINRFRTTHPGGGKGGSYAYQWQWADISGTFSDVPQLGATDENFLPEPLADSKEFRRIVQSTANRAICLDTSSVVTISITPKIENNLINLDDVTYLCYDDALLISGSDKLGTTPLLIGGNGSYVIKWEDKTLDGAWEYTGDGSGDQPDYNKASYTDTRILRRIVSSDSDICIDTSLADTIVMRELPVVNSFALIDPVLTEFCETNDSIIFVIDIVNNNLAPFDFEYHDIEIDYISEGTPGNLDSINVGSLPARIEHLPQVDIKADYAYNLVSVTDNFGCAASSVPGNTITVTIYDTPVATVMMEDMVNQCGDSINLVGDQLIDSDLSYWTFGTVSTHSVSVGIENEDNPDALAILSGRTTLSYDEIKFYWNKENGASGCGSIDSTTILFSRRPDSINFIEKDTVTLFVAESGVIDALSSVEGLGDWSILVGPGVQLAEVLSGPTQFQADVSGLALDESHEFLFEFTNGSCGPYEDHVIVERKNAEMYQVFTPAPGSIGFNDKLALKGIEVAEVVYCYIYDGWGALVRKIIRDPATGDDDLAILGTIIDDAGVEVQAIWDGTGKDGEAVEDGIYYYKILVKLTPDDEALSIDGYVILKTR